jgi:hypothetical protein
LREANTARLTATVPKSVKQAFEHHFPGEAGSVEITRQLRALLATHRPPPDRRRLADALAASAIRRRQNRSRP